MVKPEFGWLGSALSSSTALLPSVPQDEAGLFSLSSSQQDQPFDFRSLSIIVNARVAFQLYLPGIYSSWKPEKLFQQNRKQNWHVFLLACTPKRTSSLNKINLVVSKSLSILSCHLCTRFSYFQKPKETCA